MVVAMNSANLQIYNRQDVADYYATMEDLTPCEKSLFDEFIKPGASVLDLGVGGGRTTPYLSSRASRYIGVDYSAEMVNRCQKKFPDLEFFLTDASDLHVLDSSSFDAVVFTYNGIDYVIPDEARHRCFAECSRVLKPSGILMFSSHNPRAIFVQPGWNRDHVRQVAKTAAGQNRLRSEAIFHLLNVVAASRALLRATWQSTRRMIARLRKSAFWRGEGYMLDSAHGGLLTHYSVPDTLKAEVHAHQFTLLKIMANDYPREPRNYSTDWFYYAFVKSPEAEKEHRIT